MEDFRRLLYAMYQEANPEKFNEDLINGKKNENILRFTESIGKGLEILPGIEYLETGRESLRRVYKNTKTEKAIDIEKSYLEEIYIKFKIYSGSEENNNYEEKIVTLRQYFPILIDGQFMIINGVTYTPIYQLIDSETYRNRDNLVLRNQVMPVRMGDKVSKLEDMDGNEYEYPILNLFMFKSKVNIFLYYFAKMGVEDTLSYFGFDEILDVIDLDDKDQEFLDNYVYFKPSNSIAIGVNEEILDVREEMIIVCTFISVFNSRLKFSKMLDQEYWIKQLGNNFTKNNSSQVLYEKGINILISFERCLDSITKLLSRWKKEDKEDVYATTRFMARNYEALSKMDNMNLNNKRFRNFEMLIYPLQNKLSDGVYRLLNKKNPTLDEIESIFKIPKGFLIRQIINTKTLRYVNSVNSYDLFSICLKGTLTGPQSMFESKKSDNMRQRIVHPSYLGRIDLLSTSAGDPGVSIDIVPFLELEKDMHFTKKYNIKVIEEDEESSILASSIGIEDDLDIEVDNNTED